MVEKSIIETDKSHFRTSIPELGDKEILDILKKRKMYQPEAAKIAIQEAIKRGLINSEQDLFAEKFQYKHRGFSLFPVSEKENIRGKLRKSIARIILLSGAAPVIWGVIKIIEGQMQEGFLLIVLGAIWIYAAARQFKKVDLKQINILFLLLAAAVFYVVKIILVLKNPYYMDFLIPLFLVIAILYGLIFIRRLK